MMTLEHLDRFEKSKICMRVIKTLNRIERLLTVGYDAFVSGHHSPPGSPWRTNYGGNSGPGSRNRGTKKIDGAGHGSATQSMRDFSQALIVHDPPRLERSVSNSPKISGGFDITEMQEFGDDLRRFLEHHNEASGLGAFIDMVLRIYHELCSKEMILKTYYKELEVQKEWKTKELETLSRALVNYQENADKIENEFKEEINGSVAIDSGLIPLKRAGEDGAEPMLSTINQVSGHFGDAQEHFTLVLAQINAVENEIFEFHGGFVQLLQKLKRLLYSIRLLCTEKQMLPPTFAENVANLKAFLLKVVQDDGEHAGNQIAQLFCDFFPGESTASMRWVSAIERDPLLHLTLSPERIETFLQNLRKTHLASPPEGSCQSAKSRVLMTFRHDDSGVQHLAQLLKVASA
jgi:hypothetical protein